MGTNRIHEHAQRRDGEIVAIHPAQGIRDGRDKVGATTDWLGDKNVGAVFSGQLVRGVNQRVKAAAEEFKPES